jgi:hypothetical protein
MPIITAIQEAEIRRITVSAQPRQKKKDLFSKIPNTKRGAWWSYSSGKSP